MYPSTLFFTGNSNKKLAAEILNHLQVIGGKIKVGTFSDGEISVEIKDNVRGKDVFVIQSTCRPVNDTFMELLIMVDALKRASANTITAVIPYFGYARQDRRVKSARVPITAKLVANMLEAAGVNKLVTMDVHSDQIQGFFNITVDNIYSMPVILQDINEMDYDELVIVSGDIGGVARARAFASKLGCDLVIIDKRREKANQSEVMNIIGEVKDRTCVIVDDMVDTAGTLCNGANALMDCGAQAVYAYCTHGVLSGDACENITNSKLTELIVCDTIPLDHCDIPKLRQLSVSYLLAETIRRMVNRESVSKLYA